MTKTVTNYWLTLACSMLDTYRHKGLRKKLVDEMRGMGIQDERVLEAIGEIPRHFFLDKVFVEQAYANMAFQIGAGQTISQPYTVSFQSELLQFEKGMKVLEIGTGSGYQTAVLCEMGAKVYTIERQRELFLKSKKILQELGYRVNQRYGDGYEGWEAYAPFDRIIITCGAPNIPQKLVEQLVPGGRMVIPVGEGAEQKMLLAVKSANGEIDLSEHGDFRFVPMLNDKAR